MRHSTFYVIVAFGLGLAMSSANAQSVTASSEPYVPRLADIMSTTQLRHMKLSYAGKAKNWTLANYELGQIKISFQDAMRFYPNVPIADMTIMGPPSAMIDVAIQSKNVTQFAKAFDQLTAACNSCHRSQGMGFIAIKVPTSSPFSDQEFSSK